MCGIAGLFRPAGLVPRDVPAVGRMTEAQAHRGPAASGAFHDAVVALGHRRLSIIDLSDAASQPMSNEDGSVRVAYNGGYYNFLELRRELVARGHAFKSQSDTEVIVHGYEEWGVEGLLSRLRGMFAFGLYHQNAGLLLARDRLGIKPLYYATGDHRTSLMFASEVRALLASGLVDRNLDAQSLAGFLLAGSVPGPQTMFKQIRALAPGHYLRWRGGEVVERSSWDVDLSAPQTDEDEPISEFLQDVVTRHLVSDVPLGVFLSGGVDSAALVALASRALRNAEPLKTLTVTFDEAAWSEADGARAIARHFGTDHREIRVTRDDFVRALPGVFAAMDQPTNDGVNTYFVSKAAKEAGLTVVLSGLGGDEVFWGYRHYRWLAGPAGWLARVPDVARLALSRGGALVGRLSGRENWMRLAFLEGGASGRELYLAMRGFFPPAHVARLLGIAQSDLDHAIERQVDELPGATDGAAAPAFNYIEMKRYLHDQLLRDTDVFSMAHSIEARVPLLDHLMVERAVRMPASTKLNARVNKPVLVDAVNDPMLERAAAAPKRGFALPMDAWMKASAGQLEEMATSSRLLDRTVVRNLWSEFRAGRLHWSRAWALTVLGATAN